MRHGKRAAALLLAGAMLFSAVPAGALAAEQPDTGGLCEHHPAHTDVCGYTEGEPGTPCAFACEICNAQESGTPAEPECVCETLCTEETRNTDCPVCGASDAGLTACTGEAPQQSVPLIPLVPAQQSVPMIPLVPAQRLAPEAEEEPDGLTPQFLAELRANNTVTVTTTAQFLAALENTSVTTIRVGKVITLIDKADDDHRVRPIMIPGGKTIVGTGADSLLVSRAPIQLTGDDVTFRDIGLVFNSSDALGSIPHREIFLAGHSLTLDNVNTYLKGNDGSLGGFGSTEAELLPTVYAGGYRGTDVGNNASLTVENANSQTIFQAIHMGHDAGSYEMVPYNGTATLNLDAKTTSREGVFTDKNSGATIKITGENTETVRVKQFTGNDNTTLTLTNVSLDGAEINGVGKVALSGTNTKLTVSAGALKSVSVPADTTLNLTALGNAVIAGTFDGGGQLEFDPNGSVTIGGTITGTTTVAAGSFLSPQPLIAGRAYIIPASEMGEGNLFVLPEKEPYYDSDTQTYRFSLDYINGRGWVASQLYADAETPTIGSIEILSAPTAVSANEIKRYGEPTDVTFQIVWRDQDGAVISSSTVLNEGFHEGVAAGDIAYTYGLTIKTDDLNNSTNDASTDWKSGLLLYKGEDDPSDWYELYNESTTETVPAGNYTLLLLSEGVELENKTLAEVKAAIQGKVKAQTSFDVYAPADPGDPKTNINTATIAPIPDQTYTGRPVTPPVTVTLGNKKLTAGTDYVVNYENNTEPGKVAAAKVIGIGQYSGEKTVGFNIVAAPSALSLTVNGDKTATAKYGDTLRFVFQAAPDTTQKRRLARAVAENTVEFVCGTGGNAQVIGTANVSADGQAVLTYNTTDRKIPIGTSQIGVRFGGSPGLQAANADNLATVTLNKTELTVDSVALQDFTYDGKTKETDLLYATVDGQTVALTGKAQLGSANAGEYKSAKVLSWALDGEEAAWYTLPTAPDNITVEPAVSIRKKEHPAPADQYITVRPGETVTHNVKDLLPQATATMTPDTSLNGVVTAYDNQTGILTITAGQAATSPIEGTVSFAFDNYQTVTMRLHITVTNDTVTPPAIQAADREFDGQPYDGLTGADVSNSNVELTYYDLTEQTDLAGAPTNAGRYSVTAKWKDGTPGVTSVNFSITPMEITVTALDKQIKVGGAVPSLDNPQEGTDYTLSKQPIANNDLGAVRMGYERTPDNAQAGSYPILIAVENPNPNYAITSQNGTLTITNQPQISVTGVTLNKNTLELKVGESATLTATVAPDNATNPNVTWATNRSDIATVADGKVTAVAPGTAVITVTTADGGHTATCTVTVNPADPGAVPVTGVTLDQSTLTLTAGGTAKLTATVQPTDATNQNVTWSSDKDVVATVDQTGKVTAVAPGTAVITVTTADGGHTATCTVTVNPADPGAVPVTGVTLDQNALTLTAGGTAKLTATVAPDNASNKTVTWSSDKDTVATVDQTGLVKAVAPGSATITVITAEGNHTATCVVTVRRKSGGSSGGSSGSSSSSKPDKDTDDDSIVDRPTGSRPDTPTTAETKPVKPDRNGRVAVNHGAVQSAIRAAEKDAKERDNTEQGIAVIVPVEPDRAQDTLQVTIQAQTLDALVDADVQQFTVQVDEQIGVCLDLDALKQLKNAQKKHDIVLHVDAPQAQLSQQAQAAIGDRPIYDVTLYAQAGGSRTPIRSLDGRTVTLQLPYTPAANEQESGLRAVYVDEDGVVTWLDGSYYDADLEAVILETDHFSLYGVGYQAPAPVFTDVDGHWAAAHIRFVTEQGLFAGTGDTTFSPDAGMTRGMFVTVLGRLAGIDPADYRAATFLDVPADAYYAPYINWAAQTGVVTGTTADTFSPDAGVTREQMAVILSNYIRRQGETLPQTLPAVTFADDVQISSWAKEAVRTMQQAGILAGTDGNRFAPQGAATRAEVAAVLHRFVEAAADA